MSRSLPSRRFGRVRRRALAVIGAGLAPALATAPAHAASCDAAHLFTYTYATAAATQLSYAASYSYTGTNPLGQSASFTVSFQTYGLSSSVVAGLQMPRIDPAINDGSPATANNLMIGMILAARTVDITANTSAVVANFAFTTPIRDLTVETNDIDFSSNQYRDWLQVTGSDGTTTYNPDITTPFGQSSASGGAKTATNSTLQLGASSTPLTVAVNQAIGNATNPNTANGGTINAAFPQPVKTVQLRYGNSSQSPGGTTTGQQAYGIQKLTWCAMPALAVTKTSTPLATSGMLAYNIPGADMVYTITLSNSGGSDLDLASVNTVDALPATTSFFNGAFNGTTATPIQTVTSGGATVTTTTVTYSSNGTTFTYTPAAGYDPAVRAFNYTGVGTIPAGGSVALNFRAQIR